MEEGIYKKEDFEIFVGKKIKLVTSKAYYTGFIKELRDSNLLLIDKFGKFVLINYSTVESIVDLGDISYDDVFDKKNRGVNHE